MIDLNSRNCDDGHEYASHTCSACGQEFCFSCCGGTNVHHGGKYEPDSMSCPVCGYDIYSDDDPLEWIKTQRRRLEDRIRKDMAALRHALYSVQEGQAVVNARRFEYLEERVCLPLSLEVAYQEVRDSYPKGPEDLLEFHKYIQGVNPFDQRSLDIVVRYRSASRAGEYHDVESIVELKRRFLERYNISPEL